MRTVDARPEILSEGRAAELLDVLPRTVRRWVKKGTLPGRILPDGSAVILADELREWIAGLPTEPRRV